MTHTGLWLVNQLIHGAYPSYKLQFPEPSFINKVPNTETQHCHRGADTGQWEARVWPVWPIRGWVIYEKWTQNRENQVWTKTDPDPVTSLCLSWERGASHTRSQTQLVIVKKVFLLIILKWISWHHYVSVRYWCLWQAWSRLPVLYTGAFQAPVLDQSSKFNLCKDPTLLRVQWNTTNGSCFLLHQQQRNLAVWVYLTSLLGILL